MKKSLRNKYKNFVNTALLSLCLLAVSSTFAWEYPIIIVKAGSGMRAVATNSGLLQSPLGTCYKDASSFFRFKPGTSTDQPSPATFNLEGSCDYQIYPYKGGSFGVSVKISVYKGSKHFTTCTIGIFYNIGERGPYGLYTTKDGAGVKTFGPTMCDGEELNIKSDPTDSTVTIFSLG